MHTRCVAAFLLLGSVMAPLLAQSLQDALNDIGLDRRWRYDDWESASAAAQQSGKPILALFR